MRSNAEQTPSRWGLRESRITACIVAAGGAVLLLPNDAFAFASARFAIEEICGHMTGSLGGLLMTVAGIGGLVAAAFGNFRASQSFIVTAIGAFAIGSVLSIYFEDAAAVCDSGGGGGGGGAITRTTAASARTEAGDPFNVVESDLARSRNAAARIGAGIGADFSKAAELPQGQEVESADAFQQFDPLADEIAEDF
ncbi:MAG: hypothetical protein KDD69_09385 [Bdellovibrionales bacterium]|nr:hypothetical protein [Bdellovibrionales bacterium]